MNRNRNKINILSSQQNAVLSLTVGQVEAVGPDWKPLQNHELTGTIVNFTVFYYRDRTDEDEYTTRYSWQRPPTTIKQTYWSVNIPMDENGVARLRILSVPGIQVQCHYRSQSELNETDARDTAQFGQSSLFVT